jgi:phage terminase large subunit-like protein
MIERARISPAAIPTLKRIVVAVDPAVSVGENSDETGIVVCGLGEDDLGYVLADGSGKFLPAEWARKVVSLYHHWRADRVIAEVNQGGDLVESTIRAVDTNVSFRRVHAKKGKFVRAEPISALFEQNRVKIAGSFPALEDQLCSYDGSGDLPDRLDSMVYALIDLMVAARVLQFLFAAVDLGSAPPNFPDSSWAIKKEGKGSPIKIDSINFDFCSSDQRKYR